MNYPASLNSKFDFGKHKGKNVAEIIENEPTYIKWCIENIDNFELDNEAYEEYECAIEDWRDRGNLGDNEY